MVTDANGNKESNLSIVPSNSTPSQEMGPIKSVRLRDQTRLNISLEITFANYASITIICKVSCLKRVAGTNKKI